MKALSIKEPWISLINARIKTIETRTWKTKYRGKILLVGSKKPKGEYSGLASCTAILEDCRPMIPEDETKACCSIYPKAQSWILKDIRPIKFPFPVQGKLGLYDVEEEL